MRTFRFQTFLAAMFLTAAAACFAPAPRAAEEPSTPGALRAVGADGTIVEMPLRHTDVAVEITAFVARVRVEQVFENPFDAPVEAVYTFPLGDRAAVDDFELVSGPRVIRGEVRERREARRTYEKARAQGLVAALLEQERPNVFTQSVANLVPGYEVRVRLQTVELLDYTAGMYEFVFPLVVAPRYVPRGRRKSRKALADTQTAAAELEPAAVPDAGRITPPYLAHGYRSGHDVAIEVFLDAGVPFHDVVSPSHRIEALRVDPTRATIRLLDDDRIPNKDFILRWTVAQDRPTVGLLCHRSAVDGYFALLVQPEGEITPEEAAPKELILVLDASGSMAGRPLSIAKRFVRGALETLGPRDTFNIVAFSEDARFLSPEPLENTETVVRDALHWVDDLRGDGGTEMLTGLQAALARPADPDRVRIVVFLSDGEIGNEPQILAAVKKAASETRVFTVGIGRAVNHYLLDRMAKLGRGATALVPGSGPAPESLERFRAWVTRPYLTGLEIDWGALPVLDTFPERPDDLFSGQTLVLVGRYAGAAEGDVTVRGRLAGRYWEQTVRAVLPDAEPGNAALGSTWARRRIEELLTAAAGAPPADGTRREVTRLGLEFRLMTPYTSFVAVDESTIANPGGAPLPVRQALPLPEGAFETGSGEITEFAKVAAKADVIALERASISTTIGDEFVQDLPVQGRAYTNIVTLAPGVADPDDDGSPNVYGARERDFATVVGGVGNVDALTGLHLSNLNVDAIDEIEIVTAGAGVEYGRAQGGFANVVEKQGSNAVEGSLRLTWSSSALDGDGAGSFRSEAPDFGTLWPALQVSGPIAKDELWYAVSGQYLRRRDPIDVGSEMLVSERSDLAGGGRLTWQVSPRSRLSFGASAQRWTLEGADVSSLSGHPSSTRVELRDSMQSLEWTVPYSPRLLVESSVAVQDSAFETGPAVPAARNACVDDGSPLAGAWCFDASGGRVTGPSSRLSSDDHRRYVFRNRIDYYGGRFWGASHRLKFGVEAEDERLGRTLEPGRRLYRIPGQGGAKLLARLAFPGSDRSRASASHLSLYFEDEAKPSSSLTVVLGARIDRESLTLAARTAIDPRAEWEAFAAEAAGLPAAERAALANRLFTGFEGRDELVAWVAAALGLAEDGATPYASTALDALVTREPAGLRIANLELSPSFSVAWDPWRDGKTKLAVSARRYYADISPATLLVESEPVTVDLELREVAGALEPVGPFAVNAQTVDRGLTSPYQDEVAVTFEREVAPEVRLRLSHVDRNYHDQFQQIDLNHAPDVLNPMWGDLFLLTNSDRVRYRAWMLELVKRQYRNWQMDASYTFSRARGAGEPFDPLEGDGRTLLEDRPGFESTDRRHVFKFLASAVVPWAGGFRIGGSLTWQSGLPYSLLDYGVSTEVIPPLLEGLREPVVRPRLRYATGARNDQRNVSYWNADLRLTKEYTLHGGFNMEVSVDVLNLTGDGTLVVYNNALETGRQLNGFSESTRRFGRRYQLGLRIVY